MRRERGRRPNYLAVNFYGIGDVVQAADELNGVAPERAGRRRLRPLTRAGCGRDDGDLGQDAGMAASTDPNFVRNLLRGALVGAIIGLVIGALARAIVGSGSLLIYEIVAGLAGVVLGAILGAFYGGAISLPRRDR